MTAFVHADSAFITGLAHLNNSLPCQDYALSGLQGALGWAVVADGCSTGGHTDVGARLWAHAAARLITRDGVGLLAQVQRFADQLVDAANPMLSNFAFEDGYSTLGAVASDGVRASAVLFGDGVVVALQRDGTLVYWTLTYAQNAPRYLNYQRQPESLAQWEELVGPESLRIVRNEYRIDAGTVGVDGQPEAELLGVRTVTTDGRRVPGYAVEFEDLSNVQALFVCTDGVSSFDNQSAYDSILPLTQVKNPTGFFLRRRLGALQRQWRVKGQPAPHDDLAIAGLWLA